MKKLKNTRMVGTAVITVALACCHSLKPDGPEATITSVEPQKINSRQDTALTITGETFSIALLRDVGCGHGTAIATDDTYQVELIPDKDESTVFFAAEVNWIDENNLEAWINAESLPPGDYSIRVIDPWGRFSELMDAVKVLKSGGDDEFDTDSVTSSDSENDPSTSDTGVETDTDTDTDTQTATDSVSDTVDETETETETWDSTSFDSGGSDDSESDTDSGLTEVTCEEICSEAASAFESTDDMLPESPVWEHGEDGNGRYFWGTHIGAEYDLCESARLTSVPIDLTPCDGRTLELTFNLKYEYDTPLGNGYSDGLTFEFFDGASWETVIPDGGWDVDEMQTSYAPPEVDACPEALEIEGHGCFSGSSEGWTQKVFRLEWIEFPPNFQFRLIHGSDWEKNYDGTYLDAVDFRAVVP